MPSSDGADREVEPCPQCKDTLFVQGSAQGREYRCTRCGVDFSSGESGSIPVVIRGMPASRTVVYRRIAAIGPARKREILAGVPYSDTTVKEALSDLASTDHVEMNRDPNDGRAYLYEVSETE
ncbi:hypothetical protein BRC81_03050 [Halobacteriales archaeon QS_1_68_20]|nr:MAG: hypothetical protein BRC81_03050 [Halobacteriales archaeon QS_1_68_20]